MDNLNKEQKNAVLHTDGPLLILAGAGSGKTKVVTEKIAYLIREKNIDPLNILAITFTNKAAKEMKSRLISKLGTCAYDITASTFHSFGLNIIKDNYNLLDLERNVTILDGDDSLTVVKKIIKEKNLDTDTFNARAIKSKISSCKNELIDYEEYKKFSVSAFDDIFIDIYKKYNQTLKINNSIDFDDLLMMPIVLFNKYPNILKIYQEKYKYVFVDEYQDTNRAQYILTKMISAKYLNICVVGDNDQSIYSWRGANFQNILNFEKDFINSKTIMLEENYRSTKKILDASNDVIKNNKLRIEKNLRSNKGEGELINYYRARDEKDEAHYVVTEVKKLIDDNINLNEIAVLYRTNAQSRAIEEAFLKENIAYKIFGSYYFYNRAEIKDLISYLKLVYNDKDDISLQRVINVPKRGIGNKTIDNLVTAASENNCSIYEAINSGKELEFKKIIESIKAFMENATLSELIDYVIEVTDMKTNYSNNELEQEIKLSNMYEFKSIAINFEDKNGNISLGDFLEEILLVADKTEYSEASEKVTLMTIHSAKGLEFDNVFVVGLEEGIFPHANSLADNLELEEERRLCYVALTRCRVKLSLINARKRLLYGREQVNIPSRFIDEINEELLQKNETNIVFKNIIDKEKMYYDKEVEYNIGETIIHDTYGEGIITKIEDRTIQVAFAFNHGIKTLMKNHKSIKKKQVM